MFIIKMFTIIVSIIFIIIFAGMLLRNNAYYSRYIEVLNKNEFFLKSLLPFGLYILDKYSYTFNSNYDRRILNDIIEIYGQEYSAFYVRIFHANKIVLVILFIICELLLCIIVEFQLVFLMYVLLIFGVLIISDDLKLKNKVKKRRLEIRLEFPDFINKLTLLLNAGLTMSKAWEKISADYNTKGYFYSEVFKAVCDIKSGKNESEAFGEFAKRVKTPEISRLMSTIVQNTKRGGNSLVLSLRLQSNECWEMRKNAVKRLGEEASTKLLFPMMIMFLAIIIIVVTPAIISMQGI